MPAETRSNRIARHLLCAQEDERLRLAEGLHNEMGQQLAALLLGLKTAESPRVDLVKLAEQMGESIHRMALELRPAPLDDLGLVRALSDSNEQWARAAAVKLDFHASGFDRGRPPDPMETALYRIVQEALREAIRTGGTKHISVILKRIPGQATAIVEDDSAKGPDHRPGIAALEERALLCGGDLQVEFDGQTTTLFVRLPIPPHARPTRA